MKIDLEILEERIRAETAVGNFDRAFRLCNKAKRDFGAAEWARLSGIVLHEHSHA